MNREEAIEIVRNIYQTDKEKEALVVLIPELRESKDERIRERLIQVVSAIAGGWPFESYGITKKEAITYLKKQVHVPWSEEDEMMRNNILSVLSCFVGTSECESNPSLSTSYPLYQREKDWLKFRCPSFKLSEEDKRILKGIIGKIDHDQTYGVSKVEMLTFLKRLLS